MAYAYSVKIRTLGILGAILGWNDVPTERPWTRETALEYPRDRSRNLPEGAEIWIQRGPLKQGAQETFRMYQIGKDGIARRTD